MIKLSSFQVTTRWIGPVRKFSHSFSEPQAFGAFKFPSTIEIRYAGQGIGTLKIESFQVGAGTKTAARN